MWGKNQWKESPGGLKNINLVGIGKRCYAFVIRTRGKSRKSADPGSLMNNNQGGFDMKKRTMIARALCASMVISMLGGFAVQADEGEKVVINFYEHSDSDVIAEDLVEAYNASQDKVEVKLSLISNDD